MRKKNCEEKVGIKDYQVLEAGLYDSLEKSKNPIRRFYHQKRFEILYNLVKKYYKNGDKIVDLACGNCNWNKDKLPVIGVDVSYKMLSYTLSKGRIIEGLNEDVLSTSIKSKTVDIVVAAGILEHLEQPNELLNEIRRILKDDGIVIASAPYDTFFSLWYILFNTNCFLEGYILKYFRKDKHISEYLKNKGGHIQHFSPKTFTKLFIRNKFKVIQLNHNKRLDIFLVARKIIEK